MPKATPVKILHFIVSDSEMAIIEKKRNQAGITNLSAFLRALVLTGYIMKLDIPQIRDMIRLLGNMTNNINQLTKRVNAGGSIYETELDEIKDNQQILWEMLKQILDKLNRLK